MFVYTLSTAEFFCFLYRVEILFYVRFSFYGGEVRGTKIKKIKKLKKIKKTLGYKLCVFVS